MCTCCDTLRNDADTGDECISCGWTYEDGYPFRCVPPDSEEVSDPPKSGREA